MSIRTYLLNLKNELDGELHDDLLHKSMYATDASVYREHPLAIVIPKHRSDIQKVIHFANKHGLSLIPRAAGTSLAGQCVGNGIVVDISKCMNAILEVNTGKKFVWVEPGVVRDVLNEFLKPYKLYFGPNTSTSNRATIGGMLGNNSCGSTSIVYGSTRDHVLETEMILADGSITTFKALNEDELKNRIKLPSLEGTIYRQLDSFLQDAALKEEVEKCFPKKTVVRRNTGYALDAVLNASPINLNQLICGSEGTLGITTKIKLNLVDLPPSNVVVVAVHLKSIAESMSATVEVMKHEPTACELMDKTILDCTKGHLLYESYRDFVKDDPEAILIVEFRETSIEVARAKAEQLIQYLRVNDLGYHYPIIDGANVNNVWELRKAGLGLLANIPGDKKAVACIEDTAVAVEDLPNYINEFTQIMKSFNQDAVYYAHAGAGELHLRPVLNLKDAKDVEDFEAISKASAELVKKYNGSLSGEHGDGRVRAPFISLVLGDEMYAIFKEIKQVWDPNNIFNPGKIVDAKPISSDLRYEIGKAESPIETRFNFEKTGGILRTVEKCNGSGDCRKLNFAGGTMCPSYRATLDEKDTTRGRANVFREFLTQSTKENPFDHPEIKEAMALCISCKGCKSECPSNVDMATLKAEFEYQYKLANGSSLRDKLIANNASLNKIASKFPRIINSILSSNLAKKFLGFAKERTIPKLTTKRLTKWLATKNQIKSTKKLYLFIDEYTDFYESSIGVKAIELLNALGYEVLTVDHPESGRAFISKGFLDKAKLIAEQNVKLFSELISDEVPLIGIEPSAILSLKDEYPNLVEASLREDASKLAKNVFLIDEFLASEIHNGHITSEAFVLDEKEILFHGHCHQKALASSADSLTILNLPKNFTAEEINSGCCGMAGSFGYEKEHYALSMKIGDQVLFPAINESENKIIAATGTSCRHQIKDGTNRIALHPIEILHNALIK